MKEKSKVPAGYQAVMPYLIINNASKFSAFMKQVFGAEETFKHMRDEKTIMHAELKFNGSVIMFADATPEFKPQPATMFIYVDDADEIFLKAIAAGATPVREVADQSYGRSGGVQDPFGNTWWITSVNS